MSCWEPLWQSLSDLENESTDEKNYEFFDIEKDMEDSDYREIYASKKGDVYVLEGRQLLKIFNSTNFNDLESLRYLYQYTANKEPLIS